MQFIFTILVGKPLPLQTLHILFYQCTVMFGLTDFFNPFLHLRFPVFHLVINCVIHPILALGEAFILPLHILQFPGRDLQRLLLLIGQCLQFLQIRQICRHPAVFSLKHLQFLGSLRNLLQTVRHIPGALLLLLKIHASPGGNQFLPFPFLSLPPASGSKYLFKKL